MDNGIATRLEYDPKVKMIESPVDGLYYIMGESLARRQRLVGICGLHVDGMPNEAVFFTKRQLKALAAELPELIELYC